MSGTPLDEPLSDYLLAKSKRGGSGNYRRNAERVIREWLAWTQDTRDVETFADLDVADLEAYALDLRQQSNEREDFAASTACKYYDYVRAYLSWCASREYATENPAAKDRPEDALPDVDERSGHRQQLWTPPQRRAIIEHVSKRAHDAVDEHGHDAVKETRDRAFVATIAYSGVRGGEIVRDPNDERRDGIRWADVDLENGTVLVLGKGSQEYRSTALPPQVIGALERYDAVLDAPDEWPVFPTLHTPTLVQAARNGLDELEYVGEEIEAILAEQTTLAVLREYEIPPPAITTDGARRLMRRLSEEADVPGIDTEAGEYLELHGGRRGAGDTLVREIGWEAAQQLLRHKSPETTMDAYSHISASEVADDAGSAFEKADKRN